MRCDISQLSHLHYTTVHHFSPHHTGVVILHHPTDVSRFIKMLHYRYVMLHCITHSSRYTAVHCCTVVIRFCATHAKPWTYARGAFSQNFRFQISETSLIKWKGFSYAGEEPRFQFQTCNVIMVDQKH